MWRLASVKATTSRVVNEILAAPGVSRCVIGIGSTQHLACERWHGDGTRSAHPDKDRRRAADLVGGPIRSTRSHVVGDELREVDQDPGLRG